MTIHALELPTGKESQHCSTKEQRASIEMKVDNISKEITGFKLLGFSLGGLLQSLFGSTALPLCSSGLKRKIATTLTDIYR